MDQVIEAALLAAPPSEIEQELDEQQGNESLPLRLDEALPVLHEQNRRRAGRPASEQDERTTIEHNSSDFVIPSTDHTTQDFYTSAHAEHDSTDVG